MSRNIGEGAHQRIGKPEERRGLPGGRYRRHRVIHRDGANHQGGANGLIEELRSLDQNVVPILPRPNRKEPLELRIIASGDPLRL